MKHFFWIIVVLILFESKYSSYSCTNKTIMFYDTMKVSKMLKEIYNDTISLDEIFINIQTHVQIQECKFVRYKKISNDIREAIYKCENNNFSFFEVSKSSDPNDKHNIGKNDYIFINNYKFIFDSLFCIKYNFDWKNYNYCQSFELNTIYIIQMNDKKYIAIEGGDVYTENCPYLYLFDLTSSEKLPFLGIVKSAFQSSLCIGDFDNDNKLDIVEWDGVGDFCIVNTLNDNVLMNNKNMYLKFVYPPEKNYEPHIVISESKFPPLDKYIEDIEKKK